ncbi:MAG: AMP nucleosidase [Pirellulaceae bacterium]|nr:AMP nucleosidase [Pirellulaceae bacterium]
MVSKRELVMDWLPRYTGMPLEEFGEYILLTNFRNYLDRFSERFDCEIRGQDRPMQASTSSNGLTMINFGIGSPNAASVMDLLTAVHPKGVLFLGKCGGLKRSTEIGHFILPIAAIRGDGTSDDYLPSMVPALPSFKLHKFVSEKLVERSLDYRTGVVYTTNRRVWEHDQDFKETLRSMTAIAIDMETATLFVVGHTNQIARGALLLVSDLPLTPDGVKTESRDAKVTRDWANLHLDIGIDALSEIGKKGETIKHFHY